MLNPTNVSWEHTDISPIDGMDRKLYTFNNFKVETKSLESAELRKTRNRAANTTHKIEGNCFVVAIDDNPPYFHFIYDILMQYEFLKRIVPDLKIYLIHPWPENNELFNRHKYFKVIKDISRVYGFGYQNIIPSIGDTYIFEKMPHFLFSHNPLLKGFIPNDHFAPEWYNTLPSETYPNDHRDFFIKARRYFIRSVLPYVDTTDKIYNKVFVSRKVQPGNNKRADEDKALAVEKYFRDHGYTIVYNEGLSLFEQAKIYNDATHVAGFKGSNFVNMIFCNDDAKIIVVANDDQYTVWYNFIADYLGFDYNEVPYTQRYSAPGKMPYVYTIEETLRALSSIDL